jgi:hypothetical protein
LSEMIQGLTSGYFSFASCKMISASGSVIDGRLTQLTMNRM